MTDKYYADEKSFWDDKGAEQYCSLSDFDRHRIATWIGWSEGGRVLDIGGGSGMVSEFVAQQPGTECVCVDISLPMLRHASVPSVQADALALPFCDTSFDLVVAAAFLHHLPGKEERLMSEIFRVLRPGGRLVGYDPSARCLQNRLFMTDLPWRLGVFSPDERPIDSKRLSRLATEAGFSRFECRPFSFKNDKMTLFEFVQRYVLTPLAVGPLRDVLERWLFWSAYK